MNFLNNMLAYRVLESDYDLDDANDIDRPLADRKLRGLSSLQLSNAGFERLGKHYGYAEDLPAGRGSLIRHVTQKKAVSRKAIDQAVRAEAARIAQEEGRKVFARERVRIKEAELEKRLPHADVELSDVFAVVSAEYILVFTGSVTKAEALLNDLRGALPGLRTQPIQTERSPVGGYTHWFCTGEVGGDPDQADQWSLGNKFTIHNGSSDSEVVKGSCPFQGDQTLSDWVASSARNVTALELHWDWDGHTVSFVCDEMLAFRSIKWPQLLKNSVMDEQGDSLGADPVQDLMVTVSLASSALHRAMQSLLSLLGGEFVREAQHETDDTLI